MAEPAVATFPGFGMGMEVFGEHDGEAGAVGAGELEMTVDGAPAIGFCLELRMPISPGASGLEEMSWSESGVSNLGRVTSILESYESTTDVNAAATQAAIWHLTDGFDLTGPADVKARYDQILSASEGDSSPEPLGLTVTPATAAGTVGDVLPFDVVTTASDFTVDADMPLTATKRGDGSGFDATATAAVEEAEVTVTTSDSIVAPVGRVFGKQGTQKLILADPVPTERSASETVTVTFAPGLTEVTPDVPTLTNPTCESDEVGVNLPSTEGVDYEVVGEQVPGGTVTVTASAQEGFTFPEGAETEWVLTFDEVPTDCDEAGVEEDEVVLPTAPTFNEPTCDAPASIDVPDIEGIEYTISTDAQGGATVTVTATAQDGYSLPEDATTVWTHTFDAAPTDCGETGLLGDQTTLPATGADTAASALLALLLLGLGATLLAGARLRDRKQ